MVRPVLEHGTRVEEPRRGRFDAIAAEEGESGHVPAVTRLHAVIGTDAGPRGLVLAVIDAGHDAPLRTTRRPR